MKTELVKVELGGGHHPIDGHLNLDILDDADIYCDLEQGKLPFDGDSVDHIAAIHCLEHIRNLIPLMNECHRVLKPAGTFLIEVPLANTVGSLKDPTHVRQFIRESFDYFDHAWDYPRKPDYGIKLWIVRRLPGVDVGTDYETLRVELQKPVAVNLRKSLTYTVKGH